VISVDANYPVVAAQSGFVGWGLSARVDAVAKTAPASKPTLRAVDASGGDFLTQVPGEATLRLEPRGIPLERANDTVLRVLGRLKATRPGFSARLREEKDTLVITTHGKAVHSSVADEGHDALWDLGAVALALPLEDNGLAALLRVIGRRFDGDLWGEKLGLSYRDPLMGRLMVVPTLLRVKDGQVSLGINMRRPKGKTAAEFGASLDAALKAIAQETQGRVTETAVKGRYVGDPFVADTSGPLVKTLLSLYARAQGLQKAAPISVRGGTYARLFPGAVDFGPSLPGEPYAGHAPDESISLANLALMSNLLAEASWTFALAPHSP
jgi:acetylornithine deacetylase/succinyl-diaminopimelate desuccinylase-like protein